MKRKFLFYWRIFFLVMLLLLYLIKVISLDTFLTVIVGIIVFVGIPEGIKAIKNKDQANQQAEGDIA